MLQYFILALVALFAVTVWLNCKRIKSAQVGLLGIRFEFYKESAKQRTKK